METPSPRAADEPVYVISVAARLVALPGWVLRVLDQEGVVVPSRTDSNRRLYSDNDIALLNRVRHLTEERGVNIAGVKVILEMERTGLPKDPPPPAPALPTSPTAIPPRLPPALSPHQNTAENKVNKPL